MEANEITARLEELAGEIYRIGGDFALDHSKSLMPNKAAAARCRKLTLEMEKACKEYRKLSLESTKK